MKIGIAGITHLGLVTGLSFAHRGYELCFYDADSERVTNLSQGKLGIFEPGVDEIFQERRAKIAATSNLSDLSSCDIIYIAQDVVTDEHNRSDVVGIAKLARDVLKAARENTVVVMHSQIPPGFMRKLDSECSKGVSLYYQVETLVFGIALQRALEPERYILGCRDQKNPLPEVYRELLALNNCPIMPMRFESAELTKISINMFLVSTTMTASMLSELAREIGGDWNEVAPALRLDKRIGAHAYLAPGLGIAGGNLERDLVTAKEVASEFGTEHGLISSWETQSTYAKSAAFRLLQKALLDGHPKASIGVWGIAYKEGTHSTKNAPSLTLFKQLKGCQVKAYDPQAAISSNQFPWVTECENADQCLSDTDALVVLTPWRIFKDYSLDLLRRNFSGKIIIDPFAVLNGGHLRDLGYQYYTLGRE